jgi:hypothetical protein
MSEFSFLKIFSFIRYSLYRLRNVALKIRPFSHHELGSQKLTVLQSCDVIFEKIHKCSCASIHWMVVLAEIMSGFLILLFLSPHVSILVHLGMQCRIEINPCLLKE